MIYTDNSILGMSDVVFKNLFDKKNLKITLYKKTEFYPDEVEVFFGGLVDATLSSNVPHKLAVINFVDQTKELRKINIFKIKSIEII